MRGKIFSTLFFISLLLGNAQDKRSDSLLKLLEVANEDISKVNLLLKVGGEFENNDPQRAASYYEQAKLLSSKLSYDEGVYNSLVGYSLTYYRKGSFDSSISKLNEAMEVSKRLNDKIKIAITNLNIGNAYTAKGDFEKAIEYSLEGAKVIEATDDELLKAKLYDALQILYNYRSEYGKAILYGEKALLVARKEKDKLFLAKCLVNLALNYNGKGRFNEAESLLKEGLKIGQDKNDKLIESTVLMNLAEIALKKKDTKKIILYSSRSLQLSKEMGAFDSEALALRALGMAYLLETKIDSAKYYANMAYSIDTLYAFKKETVEILNLLSHLSFASGNMQEGFDFDNKASQSIEIIINEIISAQSAELEKKYETEKKESQIILQNAQLQKRKNLNFVLIAAAATLLLISLLSFRNYKQKQILQQQRINELEKEKQLTATEAILKGEEQERSRLAKDLHDGLGGMLSGIKYSFQSMKGNLIMTPENHQAFERSMDMLDSSIKEMRRVAHNMMPESLIRFGLDTALKDYCTSVSKSGALEVNYQSIGLADLTLDQTKAISVYRIIQELIGNTLKHGAAKNAIVQVTKSDNTLAITVEDDGKGFDTHILDNSKGIGWINIKNRVDFLKGKLDVSSEVDRGTSTHIELEA